MNGGKFIRISTMALMLLCSMSCKHNPLKVNVSGISVDLSIQRFEKDLFSVPPDSMAQYVSVLQKKYGGFLERFGEVIHIGSPGDPVFAGYLQKFVSDTLIRNVYRKTGEVFPDLKDQRKKLTNAFRHYKYYFPNKKVPSIYTYISGFNASLIIDKDCIGIGLDRYLGETVDYYDRMGIPEYLQKKMAPEKLSSDVLYAWGQTEFPFFPMSADSVEVADNVINHMIYEGKLLYFVKAMMPGEKDETIMGYSSQQLKWCKLNEGQMWGYLIEKKLLFSTDYMTINKLTRDAPFTSYFPQESPGRAADWIGWQIVRQYMTRKGVTLETLMNNYDYQGILNASGYSPE